MIFSRKGYVLLIRETAQHKAEKKQPSSWSKKFRLRSPEATPCSFSLCLPACVPLPSYNTASKHCSSVPGGNTPPENRGDKLGLGLRLELGLGLGLGSAGCWGDGNDACRDVMGFYIELELQVL